ncbi:hypothetical protein WAF17_02635 [Bernardetia sp. ABR2-2B]|uniref:hypothetical protein n=1 Tax=Bernardetia sp. ABR2-2B TaxID=3127472 RepID=UPI0030D5BF37
MSSVITGYLRHVNNSRGELTATFTTDLSKPAYQYEFYLLFPEKEKEMNSSEYAQRFAVYQNFANHHTKISVTYEPPKRFTSSGVPIVEVTSIKEYKQIKREKAEEILKESFKSKKISTLSALHLEAKERIAVIEAAEQAEKNWLLNISGHAGEKSCFWKHEYTKIAIYDFQILCSKPVIFCEKTREDLYKKIIEYGEMKRQATAKQSLLCKKYKEENDE